jgi:electron transfer flavoprotein beta subunit
MLAAMLDYPYASLVNKIDTVDGDNHRGPRNRRRQPGDERDPLPCVLSIQTGINEPRYVGIRGIRKVASVEIPSMAPPISAFPPTCRCAGAKVKRLDYFVPRNG